MKKAESILRTLITAISRLAGWLPRTVTVETGAALGIFLYHTLSKRRRIAERNIKCTVGTNWNRSLVRQVARSAFGNLGRTLAEFLAFPSLNTEIVNQLVTIQGREHFDRALEQGKGAILLTAHLGNWEMLGASLGILGYPLVGINKRQKGEFAEIINEYREMTGLTMIYKGLSIRAAIRCLKDNNILGILTDQGGGQVVDLLGRKTPFPQGAARFARKLGCPILPTFIRRGPDTPLQHIIEICPPLVVQRTKNSDDDIVITTQLCADALSKQISAYPDQYFWLHRIWKDLVTVRKRY